MKDVKKIGKASGEVSGKEEKIRECMWCMPKDSKGKKLMATCHKAAFLLSPKKAPASIKE